MYVLLSLVLFCLTWREIFCKEAIAAICHLNLIISKYESYLCILNVCFYLVLESHASASVLFLGCCLWSHVSTCSFVFLFVPWYLLEKPEMEVSQIQFNFWIFFSNALCALALNFSIFLVIGRTGAVTIRVAGVLKDWILIALSTLIFPESTITTLNITGYAIGKLNVSSYLWELCAIKHLTKIFLFLYSIMWCCDV